MFQGSVLDDLNAKTDQIQQERKTAFTLGAILANLVRKNQQHLLQMPSWRIWLGKINSIYFRRHQLLVSLGRHFGLFILKFIYSFVSLCVLLFLYLFLESQRQSRMPRNTVDRERKEEEERSKIAENACKIRDYNITLGLGLY